ncbi:methyltransferase [Salinisphaera sp. T31B1]|uniref:methyltransferase n=1 Tax=Salinisphaera sp. T31B1 TaxID=727963 RepID=UPI00333E2E86
MKLSKRQIKDHAQIMDMVETDRRLTEDEKVFVLDHFHEGATHINSSAGAFFTPRGLARDFAIEVGEIYGSDQRCIDLCAGIGALAFAVEEKVSDLVCVELNPDYARIGRKIVPNAEWIVGSVFDLPDMGRFRWAISNPPFGNVPADGFVGEYTGAQFEYKVIETASRIADFGAFILPQQSAPFRYSGQPCFRDEETDKAARFREQTGIVMEPSCGIDTSLYRGDWKGVSPVCEIVACEFEQPKPAQAAAWDQMDSLEVVA